jgi:ABC-type uncharacterized transport system substrate-binding protein
VTANVKRREFIILLGGAAAWPLAARAQQAGSLRRIALLTLTSSQEGTQMFAAFIDGLQRLGYVEGKTVEIDYRHAEGEVKRLQPLAQELIALNPDVVLASEPSAARAIKSIASLLPIVCPTLTDTLIPELAASYARPGGSVTGIAQSVEGLTGKLLELALEVAPGTSRVGFLSNPTGASMKEFFEKIDAVARARGIAVLTEEATTRDDLSPAFDRMTNREAQAVIVPANGLFRINRMLIAQLALAAHLPAIFTNRDDVEAGGLASYGVDRSESYRRAAVYVDKILKGTKPGDIPIEFPTKIELAVNMKTAKALALTIPPSLLARADQVLE